MSHPADAEREQERRMIPSKWCNTCQSWRHTSDCGRDDCPWPPADAGAVSPQPPQYNESEQLLMRHGACPHCGCMCSTLFTESNLPSKVSAEYPNKAAGGTEAAGLLHPSTAIHVSMASGAMNDYTADQLCPKCGVVRPCYAHEPERLRELYTVRTGAPLTRQGADLEEWVQHKRTCKSHHRRDRCRGHGGDGSIAGCPVCNNIREVHDCTCGLDEALERLRSLAVPPNQKLEPSWALVEYSANGGKGVMCLTREQFETARASLAVPATEPPIDRIYELIVGAMVRMEKGERERDLAEARKLCEDYFHAKIVRAGAGDRQPQKDFETKSPANSNDSA